MKNYYYYKKEHPFPSQNHYSYVYFREFITKLWLILKCWNAPSPTFQGGIFRKVLGMEIFLLYPAYLKEKTTLYTKFRLNPSRSSAIGWVISQRILQFLVLATGLWKKLLIFFIVERQKSTILCSTLFTIPWYKLFSKVVMENL